MTREIPLSQGQITLVDDADFDWLSEHRWYARKTDHSKTFYALTNAVVDGRRIGVPMHRLIAGATPGLVVDHINRDGLDNRRANLRLCSPSENSRNRSHIRKERPGYKGAHPRPSGNRWRALVMLDGRQIFLGSYNSEIEAAVAYDRGASLVHGEFASLNFSPERDWLLPYDVSIKLPGEVGDRPAVARGARR